MFIVNIFVKWGLTAYVVIKPHFWRARKAHQHLNALGEFSLFKKKKICWPAEILSLLTNFKNQF